MSTSSRIRDLFSRAKKSPARSTSVVRHERIDEYVLDNLKDESRSFKEAMGTKPTLKIDDGEGNITEREYDLAPPLYSDLFHAHFTAGDGVEITPSDEVRESHAFHRDVMQAYVNHPDFIRTRSLTASDDIAAGCATRAAQSVLDEELATRLSAEADRSQQMQEQEERIRAAEDALVNLRGAAAEQKQNDGQVSQQTIDDIKQAVDEKTDASSQLSGLIEQAATAASGQAVAAAVDKAVGEAQETADAWSSIPGTGGGTGQRIAPDRAFELATKWKSNNNLSRIAELIGRFAPHLRFARSTRVEGGREEVVDIELGNELSLVLPSELMLSRHPLLRMQFLKRYTERRLLQKRMVGTNNSGDGPMIVLVDRSTSMSRGRTEYANAFALALLTVAHRERRDYAIIDFNEWAKEPVFFPKRSAIDVEAVTAVATTGPCGGTDITSALLAAKGVIDKVTAFHSADVIIVTDGADYWGAEDVDIATEFKARGIRIHGMVIGAERTDYTDNAAELTDGVAVAISDLSGPSDATATIAQAIT